MKIGFATKLATAIAIAAALGTSALAGDVIIKKGGLNFGKAPKAQFENPKPAAPAVMACAACKPEVSWTTTQDAKLKTKRVAIEKHACGSCGTKVTTTGPKAARMTIAEHTCKGLLASAATCCATGK